MPIRILIAEDHTLLAQGYEKLFSTRDDMHIVGFAQTYHEIIFKLQAVPADILLLDLSMPETRNSQSLKLTGFDVLEFVKSHSLKIRKLVVSNHRDYELIRKAMSLDADGYVLKTASSDDLFTAVHQLHAGKKYLQPVVEKILSEKRKDNQYHTSDGVLLTPREKEILRMVGEGLSTEDMMKILPLKKDTINEYRKSLIRKFNARNTAHLVKLAYDLNFLG